MKREILVSVVLLLAVIAGSFYFLSTYQKKEAAVDLAQGLPPQTVLALSSDNIQSKLDVLLGFDPILTISGDTSIYSIAEELSQLHEQLTKDSTKSFKGIVSVARVSSNVLGLLFLTSENLLSGLSEGEFNLISEDLYEWSVEGLTFYVSDNKNGYSVSRHLGLVESSRESFLSDSQNLFHDELKERNEFLMLNYASLNWLLPGAFDLQKLGLQKGVKGLQGIGVYDITSTEDGITLMGSLRPSSAESILNPKYYSDPHRIKAFDILPERAPMFSVSTGLQFSEILLAKSSDTAFTLGIDSFNQRNKVDIIQDFASSLGTEMVFGLHSAFDHRIESSSYIMVDVGDPDRLALFLQALDSSFTITDDSLYIGSTKDVKFLKWTFGEMPFSNSKAHFSLLDDFLLVAGSADVVTDIHEAVVAGNVFSQSKQYALMSGWLTRESNRFVYANPSLCYALPFEITLGDMAQMYPRNIASIKEMDAFAFQLVKNNDRFFHHIFVHAAEQIESEQEVLWTRSVSGAVDFGPFLVSNYVTKKNEVLVADGKGTMNLIDQNGRINWSFNDKRRFLSSPVEIDVYKNNKIQYLVSTEKSLHLLDRKGNEVNGYPINVPAEVSGQLAVFDLKGTKEYSIMVPCSDGKVYGYRANGRPIPGWSPKTLQATSTGGLQYFNKSKIDYYLLSDVAGNIYAWKTDGKEAVDPIATGERLVSNLTLRFGPTLEQCKVVAFDSTGNLVTAGLDGKVSKVLIDKNLSGAQAFWKNIDESAQKELIVHKGAKIKVVQQSGRITTSITLEEPVKHVQIVEDDKGSSLISAVLSNKIVFHAIDGSVVLEVPLKGCNGVLSLDDFTNDGALDLVTSANNEVILIKNIF